MNISLIGSILFMLSEGIMAYVTKSHSLLMDCIFDVTDLIMIGDVSSAGTRCFTSRSRRKDPTAFPSGESLFVVIKYSVCWRSPPALSGTISVPCCTADVRWTAARLLF